MLNLGKPMTVHTGDGETYECAATDACEFDPAGVTIEVQADSKLYFFPWGSVSRIEQEL